MSSLLWKRVIEIKNQKMRIIISLALSVIILSLYIFIFKNDFNIIFAYFPLATMAINHASLSSMDDILFCETLISSNISLIKMWYFNLLFISITNYLIATFLLCIFSMSLGMYPTYISISQNILSLPLSFSVLGCATIHYANYSKINQYIGTVFGLSFVVITFGFVKFVNFLPVNHITLIFSILISVVLFVFAYLFMLHSSKEKMLINTTKISNMMNQRSLKE